MYAEVTLHRRVPSRFESFTYEVPPELCVKRGQMVKIPFRNQTLNGIVRQLHTTQPTYKTKAIKEMIPLILSEKQLALAEFLCQEYGCTFGQAVDLFIPEHVWRQKILPSAQEKNTRIEAPIIEKKLCDLFKTLCS